MLLGAEPVSFGHPGCAFTARGRGGEQPLAEASGLQAGLRRTKGGHPEVAFIARHPAASGTLNQELT